MREVEPVAIVTGGARGIGRAVVERFVAGGHRVVLVDVDDAAATEAAEASGPAVRAVAADLADDAQRARIVPETMDAFGRVDVVVNNAASLGERRPLIELADADIRRVIETNLVATTALSRDAAAHLPRGGAVINIASIQELMPLATHAAYVATKGGISALTRALAVELGPRGVRVNAVRPGVIATPSMAMSRRELGLGEALEEETSPTLLRRSGRPQDVAEAVWFLASEAAGFITGTSLTVDGGRSISRRPDPLEQEAADA